MDQYRAIFAPQATVIGFRRQRPYSGAVQAHHRDRHAELAALTEAELVVSDRFWRSLVTVRARFAATVAAEAAEGRSGPTPIRFVRLVPEPALGDGDDGYADTLAMEALCEG